MPYYVQKASLWIYLMRSCSILDVSKKHDIRGNLVLAFRWDSDLRCPASFCRPNNPSQDRCANLQPDLCHLPHRFRFDQCWTYQRLCQHIFVEAISFCNLHKQRSLGAQDWPVAMHGDVSHLDIISLETVIKSNIIIKSSGLAATISLPLNTWIMSLEANNDAAGGARESQELRQKLCSVHVVVRGPIQSTYSLRC